MIQKLHRLQPNEIQQTLRYGSVVRSPSFLLRIYNHNNLTPPKCGVIVSKKVSKKATQRNKCKRIVREVFRGVIPSLKSGVFVVFIATPPLQSASFHEVKKEVYSSFQKVSLIKQH